MYAGFWRPRLKPIYSAGFTLIRAVVTFVNISAISKSDFGDGKRRLMPPLPPRLLLGR